MRIKASPELKQALSDNGYTYLSLIEEHDVPDGAYNKMFHEAAHQHPAETAQQLADRTLFRVLCNERDAEAKASAEVQVPIEIRELTAVQVDRLKAEQAVAVGIGEVKERMLAVESRFDTLGLKQVEAAGEVLEAIQRSCDCICSAAGALWLIEKNETADQYKFTVDAIAAARETLKELEVAQRAIAENIHVNHEAAAQTISDMRFAFGESHGFLMAAMRSAAEASQTKLSAIETEIAHLAKYEDQRDEQRAKQLKLALGLGFGLLAFGEVILAFIR